MAPWGHAELPAPLPLSVRNALRTIGPGAILLAASIGGGEWLVGPAIAVKHGMGVFWIATLAIILQTIINLEAIRYTLYTGEPIVSGFLRLKPSSSFWAAIYSALTVAQLGMPALGAACASVIFSALAGRLAGAPDRETLAWVTYGVMAGDAGNPDDWRHDRARPRAGVVDDGAVHFYFSDDCECPLCAVRSLGCHCFRFPAIRLLARGR
jgi:hypothetical protein